MSEDKQLIAEYIAGSQDKFKQKCIEIFGYDFNNYFNVVSSRDNKDSEHILIEITYESMKKIENDEDIFGPFDSVEELMEALNS